MRPAPFLPHHRHAVPRSEHNVFAEVASEKGGVFQGEQRTTRGGSGIRKGKEMEAGGEEEIEGNCGKEWRKMLRKERSKMMAEN